MRRLALLPLFFLSLLVPLVNAEVNLMEAPERLGSALGIGTFAGGLLITVIIEASVFIIIGVALRRRFTAFETVMLSFPVLGFCTATGWFPAWFLVLLVLIVALMFSDKITGKFTSWRGG